ncbi:tryptophan-rich sensory protein [Humibacter ginsenosidimutans]|uniref:tryptophan-rich sensory protein n=1 Tax=Humibacter ginsenosidimutans TaxID=2599293 RepID=UPI001FEEBC13|nr:tryptophan-rich sensory protein [Humibacter ginsenosidimutans]
MTAETHAGLRPRGSTVAGPGDSARQWAVLVCLLLALAGDAIGSGAFGGTPIQHAAGGALSATATMIAPAVPAFSIWAVIYLALIGYTVVQFLPSRKADAKHRALGYPMAASLLLNAAWILSVQAGMLTLSVIVIALLLAALALAFVIVARHPATGILDAVFVDGAAGLYLGWVCVATAADIAAALTAAGFDGGGIAADAWGCAVLVAVGLVGVGLALFGRGRLAPAASLVWGIAWVAVERSSGAPRSTAVAVTAVAVAVVIVVATVLTRVLTMRRGRRG